MEEKVYSDDITEYKSIPYWGQVSCPQMLAFSQRTLDIYRKGDEKESLRLYTLAGNGLNAYSVQCWDLLLSLMWKCVPWMAKKRPRLFIYHQKTGGLETLDIKNCKLASTTSETKKATVISPSWLKAVCC